MQRRAASCHWIAAIDSSVGVLRRVALLSGCREHYSRLSNCGIVDGSRGKLRLLHLLVTSELCRCDEFIVGLAKRGDNLLDSLLLPSSEDENVFSA